MHSPTESQIAIHKTINIKGNLIDLNTPKVMGILNVTPDSYYEGSRFSTEKEIITATGNMLQDGAAIIDVGGYSTRPGASEISTEEELARVVSAIKIIMKEFPAAVLSIDTFRAAVAHAAVQEGVCIINDISGGALDNNMYNMVAALKVPYILMHTRGTPQNMMHQNQYENLVKDIATYLQDRMSELQKLDVKDVIVDPGFGFAKSIDQNFELLRRLDHFKILERPLLIGLSRKSMIWRVLEIQPEEALNGTSVLHTVALLKGANILRVHDVKAATQVIKLIDKLSDK